MPYEPSHDIKWITQFNSYDAAKVACDKMNDLASMIEYKVVAQNMPASPWHVYFIVAGYTPVGQLVCYI